MKIEMEVKTMLSQDVLERFKTCLTNGVLYFNVQYDSPEVGFGRTVENIVFAREYWETPYSFLFSIGGLILEWGLEREISREETKWLVNTMFAYAKHGDKSIWNSMQNLSETAVICRNAAIETIDELSQMPCSMTA